MTTTENQRHIIVLLLLIAVYLSKVYLMDWLCFTNHGEHGLRWLQADVLSGRDVNLSLINWLLALTTFFMRLAFAVACASVACIGSRRWPSVLCMLVLDLWVGANIIYYQANHLFLNWGIIRMTTNLHGFESSVLPFLSWQLLLLPAATVIGIFVLRFFRPKRRWIWWLGSVCIACLCFGLSLGKRVCYLRETYGCSWSLDLCTMSHLPQAMHSVVFAQEDDLRYIELNSIGVYLLRECAHTIYSGCATPDVRLTDREQNLIDSCMQPVVAPHPAEGHLLFILLESFEAWLLDERDVHGNFVCPNINAWMARTPIFISREIRTEQRYGESGDGQLIVMTGLLPLIEGVACNEFGTNVYPNVAHFYDDAVIINPWRGVWCQDVVAPSYGFSRIVQSTAENPELGEDDTIFALTRQELERATVPTCVLSISISQHIPFQRRQIPVEANPEYEPLVRDYLCTARYTDNCLGELLTWADSAACMQNATIVITADHAIFSRNNPLPLLIRTPWLTETCEVHGQAYEMDVFPTMLHAIGQQDYYFRGLGSDLFEGPNSCTLEDEAELFYLSDKLIRLNYFKDFSHH